MSLQVENLEHNMAKLTIEAPADEFEKSIQKTYQKEKNRISTLSMEGAFLMRIEGKTILPTNY